MSGIFPPRDKGGAPPGGNVCNGYSPEHKVIGEGPLYITGDCTTVLTDCQMNSIASEMLAFVDHLGFPWNADRVDNMADAIAATVAELNRRIDERVRRSGDTMEGPLNLSRDPTGVMEATNKRYVDNLNDALNTALRAYIDGQDAAITAAWSAAVALVDERKVNRAGDTMTGPLILTAMGPLAPALQAATKQYVDEMTHIPEAPLDGQLYGRSMQAWVPISLDDGEY